MEKSTVVIIEKYCVRSFESVQTEMNQPGCDREACFLEHNKGSVVIGFGP